MEPFLVHSARAKVVPIVISCPHVGSEFPEELQEDFEAGVLEHPADTDWRVHELYLPWCLDMGITLVQARYSRYVIDLNRDPESKLLYDDGRAETSLLPTHSFAGEPLYREGKEPNQAEEERRLLQYYQPYYRCLSTLLQERRSQFGQVLLYDAHSIKRHVPSIREDAFCDLTLGTNEGQAAAKSLVDGAMETLGASPYEVVKDITFKGGHITRSFGNPQEGVHALQLERCRDLYLGKGECLDDEKSAQLSKTLRGLMSALSAIIQKL